MILFSEERNLMDCAKVILLSTSGPQVSMFLSWSCVHMTGSRKSSWLSFGWGCLLWGGEQNCFSNHSSSWWSGSNDYSNASLKYSRLSQEDAQLPVNFSDYCYNKGCLSSCVITFSFTMGCILTLAYCRWCYIFKIKNGSLVNDVGTNFGWCFREPRKNSLTENVPVHFVFILRCVLFDERSWHPSSNLLL